MSFCLIWSEPLDCDVYLQWSAEAGGCSLVDAKQRSDLILWDAFTFCVSCMWKAQGQRSEGKFTSLGLCWSSDCCCRRAVTTSMEWGPAAWHVQGKSSCALWGATLVPALYLLMLVRHFLWVVRQVFPTKFFVRGKFLRWFFFVFFFFKKAWTGKLGGKKGWFSYTGYP